MPFNRKTLSQLKADAAADLAAALPGADPLLKASNLNILVKVAAGMAHGHYGYLDWIANQATPYSASDPVFVAGWAGLKGVTQKPAAKAGGANALTLAPATNGTTVPAGTALSRGDGVAYVTTADAVAASNQVVLSLQAALAGANGNADAGAVLTLASPIAGVASSGALSLALTGGADVESLDSVKTRMVARYQAPPQGGARADYVAWALEVAGVTRAWVAPNGFGVGTVVVYAMMDVVEAVHAGFPQGSDGVAASERRGAPATGDQLTIANHLFPLQPAASLVYVCAPVAAPQAFAITGMPAGLRTAAEAAIATALAREATPGGVYMADGSTAGAIPLAHVWAEIVAATGWTGFQITAPTADIATGAGLLATKGVVTFA